MIFFWHWGSIYIRHILRNQGSKLVLGDMPVRWNRKFREPFTYYKPLQGSKIVIPGQGGLVTRCFPETEYEKPLQMAGEWPRSAFMPGTGQNALSCGYHPTVLQYSNVTSAVQIRHPWPQSIIFQAFACVQHPGNQPCAFVCTG